jgi:hypothetical protein
MSTVEQGVKLAIEEFVTTVTAFTSETPAEANQRRTEILADLPDWLRARFPYIFTGGSSRLICEMTNNRHGFSGNRKHCNNCGADFCTAHSLTHCVKCNHTPLV